MSNINSRNYRWEHSIPLHQTKRQKIDHLKLKRNSIEKKREIETKTKNDAKVDITDKIKEFSRIKSAVDRATEIDNSKKVALLKQKVQEGTYNINDEAIAEKMLSSEF